MRPCRSAAGIRRCRARSTCPGLNRSPRPAQTMCTTTSVLVREVGVGKLAKCGPFNATRSTTTGAPRTVAPRAGSPDQTLNLTLAYGSPTNVPRRLSCRAHAAPMPRPDLAASGPTFVDLGPTSIDVGPTPIGSGPISADVTRFPSNIGRIRTPRCPRVGPNSAATCFNAGPPIPGRLSPL